MYLEEKFLPQGASIIAFANSNANQIEKTSGNAEYYLVDSGSAGNSSRGTQFVGKQSYSIMTADTKPDKWQENTPRTFAGAGLGRNSPNTFNLMYKQVTKGPQEMIKVLIEKQFGQGGERPWPSGSTPTGEKTRGIMLPGWSECLRTQQLLRQGHPWSRIAAEVEAKQSSSWRSCQADTEEALFQTGVRRAKGMLVSANGSMRLRPDQRNHLKPLRAYEAI